MSRSQQRNKVKKNSIAIKDALAESLERKGFWLRAATRWKYLMDRCEDEKTADIYTSRREYCISMSNNYHQQRLDEYFREISLSDIQVHISKIYKKYKSGTISYWDNSQEQE